MWWTWWACRDPEPTPDADADADADADTDTDTDADSDSDADTDTDTDTDSDADPAWNYVLFAPSGTPDTWLVDGGGEAVHRWTTDRSPGQSVYLLEDGDLLRTGYVATTVFQSGGVGGSVQLLGWDGALQWEFTWATAEHHQHHDARWLPNGHVVLVAWELLTGPEWVALGRDPALVRPQGAWSEHLLEVDPATDRIVWEWHAEDHLAQDRDPTAPNYVPSLADAPGRIDVDFAVNVGDPDWLHVNGIDWSPELDQLVLSVHDWSELWIVDHATTTAESAGPAGDLMYRWGNPQTWSAGGPGDQQLVGQHNAQWIDAGLPGEGHLLVFDNGSRSERPWSRIVELVPPLASDGTYDLGTGAFGPEAPTWEYVASVPGSFYADHLGGAQRQPDGSTLICEGPTGRVFAVDEAGNDLWTLQTGDGTFRAERYPPDFPGLVGRDLTPPTRRR